MTAKSILLTMAKRPAPGQTKTRLAVSLSARQAAALYECFLKDTLALMARVPDSLPAVQPAIAYAPAAEQAYFRDLAPDFTLADQVGNSLSERLAHIANACFAQGYQRVVLMDSDSPTLPLDYLVDAFLALEDEADVVLGPCDDGGYYLIGLKQPAPRLFLAVEMSTPQVVTDTLKVAQAEKLQTHLLPTWYDVDDAASFERLLAELADGDGNIACHTRDFLARMKTAKR